MNQLSFENKTGQELVEFAQTLGIRVKTDGHYTMFNYDQINSAKFKTHPLVVLSRGIIVDDKFNIVCRPFGRFFNYGEVEIEKPKNPMFFEKVDGSLIKIWYDARDKKWQIATKGTMFGDSDVNGHNITFRQLTLDALDITEYEFQKEMKRTMSDKNLTYLYELTSKENRVVIPQDRPKLSWLATLENTMQGKAIMANPMYYYGAHRPKWYDMGGSLAAAKAYIDKKTELDTEGLVVYDDGLPVMKLKTAVYVAAHRIRGDNGLTPKRAIDLVLDNEQDEYLTVFPDDSQLITKVVDAIDEIRKTFIGLVNKISIEQDAKPYALEVQEHAEKNFHPLMFEYKKRGANIEGTFISVLNFVYSRNKLHEFITEKLSKS